jgi:hypothetical protein
VDTKSLRVEIKDADKGQVVAIFSTFNTVDHDGDVTTPGAFTDGAKTRISAYNHTSWGGVLPVGDGSIKVTPNEAQLHGQFYMDTQHGGDTFKIVKRQSEAGLQEWSYGYDVTKNSFGEFGDPPRRVQFLEGLKVHEVSPVLLGAGIGTRTLATKDRGSSTFVGEATAVLTAVGSLTDRAAEVLTMRQEKGKGFGAESAALLRQVQGQVKRLEDLLADPNEAAEEVVTAATDEARKQWLRFVSMAQDLRA